MCVDPIEDQRALFAEMRSDLLSAMETLQQMRESCATIITICARYRSPIAPGVSVLDSEVPKMSSPNTQSVVIDEDSEVSPEISVSVGIPSAGNNGCSTGLLQAEFLSSGNNLGCLKSSYTNTWRDVKFSRHDFEMKDTLSDSRDDEPSMITVVIGNKETHEQYDFNLHLGSELSAQFPSGVIFCLSFDPGIIMHNPVKALTVIRASLGANYLLEFFLTLTQQGICFSPSKMSNYKVLECSGRRRVLIKVSAVSRECLQCGNSVYKLLQVEVSDVYCVRCIMSSKVIATSFAGSEIIKGLVTVSSCISYFLGVNQDDYDSWDQPAQFDYCVIVWFYEGRIQKELVGNDCHNSSASLGFTEAVVKGLEIDSVVLQMISHIRVQQKDKCSWDDMTDQSSFKVQVTGIRNCNFKGIAAVVMGVKVPLDKILTQNHVLASTVTSSPGSKIIIAKHSDADPFTSVYSNLSSITNNYLMQGMLQQQYLTDAFKNVVHKFDQAKNMAPVGNVDDKYPSYGGLNTIMYQVYITLHYLIYRSSGIRIQNSLIFVGLKLLAQVGSPADVTSVEGKLDSAEDQTVLNTIAGEYNRFRLLRYEVSISSNTVITFPIGLTLQGWPPTREQQNFGLIPLLSSDSLDEKRTYAHADKFHSQCFASKRLYSYSYTVLRYVPYRGVYGRCSSVVFFDTDGGNSRQLIQTFLSGQTVHVNDPGGLAVPLYKQLGLYTQNGYMKATMYTEWVHNGGLMTDYFVLRQAVHLSSRKDCTKQGYYGNNLDVPMSVLSISLPQLHDAPCLVSIMVSLPATRTPLRIAATTIQVSDTVALNHRWLFSCLNFASLSSTVAKIGLYATMQNCFQVVGTIFLLFMVIFILVVVIGTWVFDPGVGCPIFYTKIQTIHLFLDIFRIDNLTAVVYSGSKKNVQHTDDIIRHALCYVGKLQLVFVVCMWYCRVYGSCNTQFDCWILSVVTPITTNNCVQEECPVKFLGTVLYVPFLPSHPRDFFTDSFYTIEPCEVRLPTAELNAIYPSVSLLIMQRRAHFHALPIYGQVSSGYFVSLWDFGARYSYLTALLARQFISMKFSGNTALHPTEKSVPHP